MLLAVSQFFRGDAFFCYSCAPGILLDQAQPTQSLGSQRLAFCLQAATKPLAPWAELKQQCSWPRAAVCFTSLPCTGECGQTATPPLAARANLAPKNTDKDAEAPSHPREGSAQDGNCAVALVGEVSTGDCE